MFWNAMGVMKTMLLGCQYWELHSARCGTDMKLIIQLALVLMAFAGPRILNGTIST